MKKWMALAAAALLFAGCGDDGDGGNGNGGNGGNGGGGGGGSETSLCSLFELSEIEAILGTELREKPESDELECSWEPVSEDYQDNSASLLYYEGKASYFDQTVAAVQGTFDVDPRELDGLGDRAVIFFIDLGPAAVAQVIFSWGDDMAVITLGGDLDEEPAEQMARDLAELLMERT